jgi:hypothetical protein
LRSTKTGIDPFIPDETGELSRADGELGVERRHAEDEVQVVAHTVDEVLLHVVLRLLQPGAVLFGREGEREEG